MMSYCPKCGAETVWYLTAASPETNAHVVNTPRVRTRTGAPTGKAPSSGANLNKPTSDGDAWRSILDVAQREGTLPRGMPDEAHPLAVLPGQMPSDKVQMVKSARDILDLHNSNKAVRLKDLHRLADMERENELLRQQLSMYRGAPRANDAEANLTRSSMQTDGGDPHDEIDRLRQELCYKDKHIAQITDRVARAETALQDLMHQLHEAELVSEEAVQYSSRGVSLCHSRSSLSQYFEVLPREIDSNSKSRPLPPVLFRVHAES